MVWGLGTSFNSDVVIDDTGCAGGLFVGYFGFVSCYLLEMCLFVRFVVVFLDSFSLGLYIVGLNFGCLGLLIRCLIFV